MISDYWKNRMMRVSFFIGTADFYLGLSSTDPSGGVNPSEPTGGGYARVKVESFSAPVNGEVHNTSDLDFPVSTGEWFTAASPGMCWCLFDGADSGANLLASGRLVSMLVIREDMVVRVPAGAVSFILNDTASSGGVGGEGQSIAVSDDGNGNAYMYLTGMTATTEGDGAVILS